MSSLSTQSYKGSRDYFPEEKRLQNYIFNVWHKTVESFGYEESGEVGSRIGGRANIRL